MPGCRPQLFSGFIVPPTPAAEERAKLQQAIDQQAEPEVHYCPQIDGPRLVLCGGRQVWREGKIEGVAQQDGNQELQPIGARRWHGRKQLREKEIEYQRESGKLESLTIRSEVTINHPITGSPDSQSPGYNSQIGAEWRTPILRPHRTCSS